MGNIIKWDREKIQRENWTRYAIRPDDRATGRSLISKVRTWFVEHGHAEMMVHVIDHSSCATFALSATCDCVLFRITFGGDIPVLLVRQPF